MKIQLEIGETEKHKLDIVINQFWGYIEIKVDGQPRLQEKIKGVWLRQNWTFSIEIGKTETHEIKIKLVRSLFPVGLRECTAWVYVDDRKKAEHTGKFSARDNLFTGMNLRTKTAIIVFSLLILTILSSLIIYSWPIRINKEIDGILFRADASDTEYSDTMPVTINGKYYRSIFSYDRFVGEVYIRDLHPDVGEETLKQRMTLDFNGEKPAILGYWKVNVGSFSDRINVGSIYMTPGVKKVMILVAEKDDYGGYGGDTGLFYAAPCDNREEALIIVNEIIEKIWSKRAMAIE